MEVAVNNANQAAMEFLIENGIDLNARISYWGTALQLAARNRSTRTLEFLLDLGADVNAFVHRSIFGSALEAAIFTPLREPWYGDQQTALNALIRRGASVSATRPVSGLPLIWESALDSSAAAVYSLLKHGADAKACDGDGHTLTFVQNTSKAQVFLRASKLQRQNKTRPGVLLDLHTYLGVADQARGVVQPKGPRCTFGT
jgi:ankyrin repeat protein